MAHCDLDVIVSNEARAVEQKASGKYKLAKHDRSH
jgi:hypothetical protein